MARLSGAPQLAPEIAVLAIAPLIMGLVNWDYRRQQRDSDFRAAGRIVLVAEVVSLIATATAAILLRDFTAILYGLIGRAAMTVIMSHAVARQRYAAEIGRTHGRTQGTN